jgi:fructan beta-fructosidase
VIDAVDTTYAEGLLGVNVFAGTAVLQHANLGVAGFRTNLGTAWRPVAGTWSTTAAGLQGRRTGDGFYLSGRAGRDFTYQADLRVETGRAVALTFRSDGGATGHYSAGIDTDGLVKLWRPGRDIAVAAVPIVPGRSYHLTVVAAGPRITVQLDRRPVIDAVDATYAEGHFGVNVFDGGGVVQDLMVS